MTYNEICSALAEAEIENNRGETAMLICHFCNVTKADLLLRRDEDFVSPELEEAVKKRCKHYPLQYILGYWHFFSFVRKKRFKRTIFKVLHFFTKFFLFF